MPDILVGMNAHPLTEITLVGVVDLVFMHTRCLQCIKE